MIVNSTDLKNNLGKYLRLATREDIIVTSNGRKIARLSTYEDNKQIMNNNGLIKEKAKNYDTESKKASYEDFLKLTESSEERYEYIDGEIYFLASPRAIHQRILGDLYYIFHNSFQGKKCRPMLAPFDITLKRNQENINVVQPDLMVICNLEQHLDERDYYMGIPTLVVEIISESTRNKDMIKKLDLYMSTGIKEYWIINPFNKEVSIYLFNENSIFKSITYKNQEIAASYHFDGLEVSLGIIFGDEMIK